MEAGKEGKREKHALKLKSKSNKIRWQDPVTASSPQTKKSAKSVKSVPKKPQ